MTRASEPKPIRRILKAVLIAAIGIILLCAAAVVIFRFANPCVREFGFRGWWYLRSAKIEQVRNIGHVQFSPDGSVVVFTWADLDIKGLGPEPIKVRQTAYLGWCAASDPADVKTVKLAEVGIERHGYFLQGEITFKFSPDSKHLAVACQGRLSCFDLGEGRHWPLSLKADTVSGFAWLSGDEVGYSTHRNIRGKYHDVSDRDFWRLKIRKSPKTRVNVFTQRGIENSGAWNWCADTFLEHWSPTGKHVVFKNDSPSGITHVLDVATGRTTTLGKMGFDPEDGVSWKPDGTAVFVLGREIDQEKATLFDTQTMKITDLSTEWHRVFPWGAHLQLEWTADGRYVLANSSNEGGYLIQPDPWRAVALGKKFAVEYTDASGRKHTSKGAFLYHLPVPGWVRAGDFAVDYEGVRHLKGWEALSPDGKWTAEVKEPDRVNIRPVRLLEPEPHK